MKITQRVTLLGGGVSLTLTLGLLYFFHFYSAYNIKPLPLRLSADENACPPVTSPCIVTAEMQNRLGNKISSYWLLIAAAKRLNCTAYLSPNMAAELLPHFRLTTPVLAPEVYYTTAWTYVDERDALSKCRADFFGENINFLALPTNFRPLFPYLKDLRRELVLKPEIVDRAQQKLSGISRMKRYETFVSVHARRGDYVELNMENRILSADSHFYSSAMDHFRSKYGHVAFVVLSDDMESCERNILSENGDVFYAGSEVAIDDFALLANCNHSVIGYSTFAYFAAILTGGDVVYYANASDPENPYYTRANLGQLALDRWTPIAANLSQLPALSPPEEKLFNLKARYSQKRANIWYFYVLPIGYIRFKAFLYTYLPTRFLS